jgi:hypothetical protein
LIFINSYLGHDVNNGTSYDPYAGIPPEQWKEVAGPSSSKSQMPAKDDFQQELERLEREIARSSAHLAWLKSNYPESARTGSVHTYVGKGKGRAA